MDYQVNLPEGQIGKWKVEKFTVTPEDEELERMRAFSNGGRFVRAGTYTQLMRGETLVMSDTPDEIRDHREPIYKAVGHCLVNGLGLGVVVNAMLKRQQVEHVTVIEIAPEVIQLVGQHYLAIYGDRLQIICSDALTWTPPKGTRYNVVWHDIWDTICADNLPEMHKLHRRYGRYADWQGSWCRWRCERSR